MNKTEYETLKARFIQVFANVPEPLRDEIISVISKEPFTWRTANAEIEHDATKSKVILEQLKKLGVI